jgi:hypothetical protein
LLCWAVPRSALTPDLKLRRDEAGVDLRLLTRRPPDRRRS